MVDMLSAWIKDARSAHGGCAHWRIDRQPPAVDIHVIAEILNMGWGVKQIEVQPDPHRLAATGDFEELERAAGEAASTSTVGFLNTGPTEIMGSQLLQTVGSEDIARTGSKGQDRLRSRSGRGEVVLGRSQFAGPQSAWAEQTELPA